MNRLLVLAVGLLLAGVPGWRACAPVAPKGQFVQIFDESAIIVWDPATKTQHFIRRATFGTRAAGLGFLVPTPTRPVLEKTSDEAFKQLERMTQRRVVTVERQRPAGRLGAGMRNPTVPTSPPVRVLEQRRISGYQYAILEADDARELLDWLKKNDYASRPELEAWFRDYIAKKWKITAFKIDKESPEQFGVAISPVRMSFKTDRPFFPYSEPAIARRPEDRVATGTRMLRVHLIADARQQGQFHDGKTRWPGKVVWANRLEAEPRKELLKQLGLPATTVGANAWLTEFEDESSPRPGGADVIFAPAVLQSSVERPPLRREVFVDPPPPPPVEPAQRWIILGGVVGMMAIALAATALILRRWDSLS